jgi:phenylacetate-CoA ligase
LPEGEQGELVFTSLTKEAMPVVRYRTRDLTRLLPGTARPMRRMDKIVGRSDDMLIIRGVNVYPSQVEEQVLTIEALAPHYLIEVTRSGNLDSVTIKVERKPDTSPGEKDAAATLLCHRIKSYIGISSTVVVCEVGEIPRSLGKAKRVLDKRR